MNFAAWIPIMMLYLVIFMNMGNARKSFEQRVKNRTAEGRKEMLELAKRFIDKECLINIYNGQLEGYIREVTDGAIMLERADKQMEAVNLDFVVRIREYPRKKNGKKKGVVLD